MAITTQGGAALCPGLICFGPFGAIICAIQLHHNHHRPVNLSRPLRSDPPRPGRYRTTLSSFPSHSRHRRIPTRYRDHAGSADFPQRPHVSSNPGIAISGGFDRSPGILQREFFRRNRDRPVQPPTACTSNELGDWECVRGQIRSKPATSGRGGHSKPSNKG